LSVPLYLFAFDLIFYTPERKRICRCCRSALSVSVLPLLAKGNVVSWWMRCPSRDPSAPDSSFCYADDPLACIPRRRGAGLVSIQIAESALCVCVYVQGYKPVLRLFYLSSSTTVLHNQSSGVWASCNQGDYSLIKAHIQDLHVVIEA